MGKNKLCYIILLCIKNFLINILTKNKMVESFSIYTTYFNLISTLVGVVYVSTYLLRDYTPYLDSINENKIDDVNTIDSEFAWKYPIIMSVYLSIFYLIVKYFKKYNNLFQSIIFCLSIYSCFFSMIGDYNYVMLITLIGYFAFCYLTVDKYKEKKMYINNMLAILVSIASIILIKVDSFRTGLILLFGLVIFDVFWVFGSKYITKESVMQEVAMSVEGPVLLKYFINEAGKIRTTLIGLGDLIIPSIYIKTLVNTDYYLTSIVFYTIGVITAIVTSILYKHGQPALLYIVPSITIPVLVQATFKGELKDLLSK